MTIHPTPQPIDDPDPFEPAVPPLEPEVPLIDPVIPEHPRRHDVIDPQSQGWCEA